MNKGSGQRNVFTRCGGCW